ncbi:MAG: MFS transporter [bacterium]
MNHDDNDDLIVAETPIPQLKFPSSSGIWPEALRSLRHRNYLYFFLGQLISLLGTWMQNAAQGWLLPILASRDFHVTNTSYYVGAVSAISSAPMFLLILFAGVLADRRDKRIILLITQTVMMVMAFILAYITHFHYNDMHLWYMIIFGVVGGITMAFDMPTRQSYVKELVGRQDIGNAIALNSAIFNSARIVGPVIAGTLIALPYIGMEGAFFINGISYIAVIIGLYLINTRFIPKAPSDNNVWMHLREGFSYVYHQRTIRLILVIMAIFSVFGFSSNILFPVIAHEVLNVGIREYTYMVTSLGIGAFVGAILLAQYSSQINKGTMLMLGGTMCGVALIAFCSAQLAQSLWGCLTALPFIGGGLIITSANINSLIREIAPDNLRGRAVSIWAFLFAGLTPLGAFTVGGIAHLTSPAISSLVGGGVCLLTIGVVSISSPWVWKLK